MPDAIEVFDLVKKYGDVAAVDGVSFKVARGRSSPYWDQMGLERRRQSK